MSVIIHVIVAVIVAVVITILVRVAPGRVAGQNLLTKGGGGGFNNIESDWGGSGWV